ncbi:hypothetical protein OH460_08720 [Vibrio sp. Makdt]|uniref:hypothetical protein n=1 Tax=Vibrio sp. Makdt TaxID=2998828 RepID=UPI0022CD3DF8|nr:hypothetical protein [Vibrio sp. Makdt]MDA0152384.1 hypothetical protein [Vibrio sp. Makdt]
MKKNLLVIGVSSIILFGCDSSENVSGTTKVSEASEPVEQVGTEMPALNKHVIPAKDIIEINAFYDSTSPDMLRTATAESVKFSYLSSGQRIAAEPVTLEQLNRTSEGVWKAVFVGNDIEYMIPLTEFSGTVHNGKELQVVVNEKGDYFIIPSIS